MNITGQDFKDCFVGMEHEFVCEVLASVLYQLFKKDIGINAIEIPEYIDYYDRDGKYHCIEGVVKSVPIEEKVELNFSRYDEKMIEKAKRNEGKRKRKTVDKQLAI